MDEASLEGCDVNARLSTVVILVGSKPELYTAGTVQYYCTKSLSRGGALSGRGDSLSAVCITWSCFANARRSNSSER